ncbi:hypothetical protein ACJW30_09G161300 [Castanea mollissima]
MYRRPVLPLGVKFDPTDVELISGYLYPKFHRGRLAWNAIGFCDLVYEKPPWEFCTDLTAFPGDEKHYFFTERKRNRNGNRVVRTVGSYGTWHESSSKKISGIGFNKLLNFEVKGEGKEMKTTDWLMHEFSLPDKKINLVLCVIQKKKKKKQKEEMGSAYDTNPETDPNSFLDCVDTSPAALDTEEEETRPSKKMRSDREFDDDKFCGGDPCPAAAHGDQFKLQALASEEEETRPSKEMQSDPNSDDHPFSVPNSSADHIPDFWTDLATGFPDDEFGLPDDVFQLTNTYF